MHLIEDSKLVDKVTSPNLLTVIDAKEPIWALSS